MRLIDADAYKERNAEIIDCEIDHHKYQDTLRELKDHKDDGEFGFEYYRNMECVAWMPLPGPYKEEVEK